MGSEMCIRDRAATALNEVDPVVAATAPSPPAARKVPLITGQYFSSNQSVEAFIDAIKQPATPNPIKPRLAANPSIVSECANKNAPNAAKNKRKV